MEGTNHTSEVARIRQQIADEYAAADRVFHGFAETAQHAYITARQENIALYFEKLTQYMSQEDAMHMLMVTLEDAKDHNPINSANE